MRALPLLAVLAACSDGPEAAGGAQAPDMAILELRVIASDPCSFEHQRRPIGDAELESLARSQAARTERARLSMAGGPSHRCIGKAVYELQRAGFRHVEMTEAPPPSDQTIENGP